MEVVSVNVGKPASLKVQNKEELFTGIVKSPVNSDLHLSFIQLEGDGQADLLNHGGVDKALCVYCHEHYAYWEHLLGKRLDPGAFGENITMSGLLESEVCIGDTFSLGNAIVQVAQPRQPCYKLADRHAVPDFVMKVQTIGYSGYYFRVLQEGKLPPNPQIQLVSKQSMGVTIEFVNQILYHDKRNVEGIQRIVAVPELSEKLRLTLNKRLQELEV
ncbi:MOSC domain-containing protein [Paenibacillus sp. GP183]|uniref:MOSC domain-containing protein n=1 Tax=Paenibacillus sp. GP183 TaxID=1882751 RepID=UPI0008967649|nr:MOSC domain-containing protein [Paenibacillus sp. GP183]SEC63502.1 MOSC domain-containing protein YiiM [Paenibacillus sp. GP183]